MYGPANGNTREGCSDVGGDQVILPQNLGSFKIGKSGMIEPEQKIMP